jgi:excisionase family DNA binding protein
MNSKSTIMNVEEVSSWLRIPLSTLYGMCRRGEIPCIKIGKHWRFEQKHIEDWMENKIRQNGSSVQNSHKRLMQ